MPLTWDGYLKTTSLSCLPISRNQKIVTGENLALMLPRHGTCMLCNYTEISDEHLIQSLRRLFSAISQITGIYNVWNWGRFGRIHMVNVNGWIYNKGQIGYIVGRNDNLYAFRVSYSVAVITEQSSPKPNTRSQNIFPKFGWIFFTKCCNEVFEIFARFFPSFCYNMW